MPAHGRTRLPSVTAWGIAALLAAAASAGPARAECGDYVHIGAPTIAAPAAGESAPKPAAPCHGPGCTGHKAPAPTPPVTPAEPGPSDAILPADPPPDPSRSAVVGSPPAHLPAGPVAAIFHPPRHS